jgi:hypothetical protein
MKFLVTLQLRFDGSSFAVLVHQSLQKHVDEYALRWFLRR